MKKKKKGLILLWLNIFILFTSIVFYVIGCNSDRLVNSFSKIVALVFIIISVICLIYSIGVVIKYKKRRGFKKLPVIIISLLLFFYIVGCSTFLLLLYGPKDNFRNWLVTTAMRTMHHQHYCKWFYNDLVISEVLSNNFIDDSGLETDAELVDHQEVIEYKDEYEREILERDKDALYKIVRFKVNGQNAYLGVVYDPSKVSVGITKWLGVSGEYIYDMAREQNAVLAINGGNFWDPNYSGKGGSPSGITIADGKIITSESLGSGGLIGFNNDNTLILQKNITASVALENGIRDAVTSGPFLIVNGESAFIKGNGGWGYAARTAIGQRKDGIVLLLVVDSNETRTSGASMLDLTEVMQRYGAINAASLDGGTSSAMVVGGQLISDPIDSTLRHKTRGIPTIFKVVE